MPVIVAALIVLWLWGVIGGLWFTIRPKPTWPLVATRLRSLGVCLVSFIVFPLLSSQLPNSRDQTGFSAAILASGIFGLPILLMIYAYFSRLRSPKRRSIEASRATVELASCEHQAIEGFNQNLDKKYPFILRTSDGNILGMDQEGSELRFLSIRRGLRRCRITADVSVPVTDLVSVELVKNERVVTETATKTKKRNALARAALGEVLFGPVGAIVGVTSAGSTSSNVGVDRRFYVSSELVFGLSDFHNPVVRFVFDNHAEADKWLFRVRGAMAKQRENTRLAS